MLSTHEPWQSVWRGRTWLLLAVLLSAILGGCASAANDADCRSAFRDADPRALPPYGASPLDEAIRTCATLTEWQAAWDAYPAAHADRDDPIGLLAERCNDAVLAETALCRDLAARS